MHVRCKFSSAYLIKITGKKYGPQGSYDGVLVTEFFQLLLEKLSEKLFKVWMRYVVVILSLS